MTLTFELLDHYNHRLILSPLRFLELSSTPTVHYRGNQESPLKQGLFKYSPITIYAPPAPRKWLFATLTYDQEDFSLHLQSNISVSFRDCVPGEILRLDCCEACFSGNFSFSPEDLEFLLFASRVLSWRKRAPCRSRVLERQYFRTPGVSIPCYVSLHFQLLRSKHRTSLCLIRLLGVPHQTHRMQLLQ